MRRIGMKGGKRRKSDTSSDADSGENGGTAVTHNAGDIDGNDVDDNMTKTTTTTPNRKRSRGRGAKKDDDSVTAVADGNTAKGEGEADDDDDDEDEANANANDATPGEQENGNANKNAGSKKRKREKQKASTSHQETNEHDGEYEVEKIVAHRMIKGRRQFLVRWKGYSEDSDTWEQEKDLSCPQLIEDFLNAEEEKEEDDAAEASPKRSKIDKKVKKGSSRRGRPSKGDKQNSNNKKEDDDDDEEETKEFEVEKIVEVHHKKNKGREFLIRWKGFTSADDTWEPEENLNCPDLISKFMEKVEKAKTAELRELRTNPAHTKRYTLTTHETGRRWSRRNVGKQRTTYYQCDE